MEKPKRQPKVLRVSDHNTKEEFMAAAREICKEHYPSGKTGRNSLAYTYFMACNGAAYKILDQEEQNRIKIHEKEHISKGAGKERLSYARCPICSKQPPIQFKRYRLEQMVQKRFFPERYEKSKNNDGVIDRTIARHIKAWTVLHHHKDWFIQGIPKKYEEKFQKTQRVAFDKIRKKAFERYEKAWNRESSLDDESESDNASQLPQLAFDIFALDESSLSVHIPCPKL